MKHVDREIDGLLGEVLLLGGDLGTRAAKILEARTRSASIRSGRKLATGRMKPTRGQKRLNEAAVYEEVVERDKACTASVSTFGPCSGFLEIDHQWGRGKEKTSMGNCRRLCRLHHRYKTLSSPSRLLWLQDFLAHAVRHGYVDEILKTERAIALEIAQRQEARR